MSGPPEKATSGEDSGSADGQGADETLIMPGGTGGSPGRIEPHAATPKPGSSEIPEIPNYTIEKKIGQGGMGAVYRARQTRLDRTVAIKVLPARFSEDETYAARLLREAKVLAKINHPNVITCYDIGEHENKLYVVMEFVEGESLYELIARNKGLSEAEALGFLKQAVLGLGAALDVGILHRDIKPDNMLLGKPRAASMSATGVHERTLKIADLGLAVVTDDAERSTRLTVEGSALGSPAYMSPEQTLGERDLDFRTDLYALGMTLYHMVTNQTPFSAPTAGAVLAKKLSEKLPDPRTLKPELSPGLSLLIQKMTARYRPDRYADYGSVLRDIDALLRGEPLAAEPLDESKASVLLMPDTLAALERLGKAAPRPAPPRHADAGSSKGLAFVLLGGAGCIVLAIALWTFGRTTDTTKESSNAEAPEEPAKKTESPPAEKTGPPEPPPRVSLPRSPFMNQTLLGDATLVDWIVIEKPHLFRLNGSRDENPGLLLQSINEWALVERRCPSVEYVLEAEMQIIRAADACEIQVPLGNGTFCAFGLRTPPDSSKVTAYHEIRSTETNKVVDEPLYVKEGFETDKLYRFRVQCYDGGVLIFCGNEPAGLAPFDPERAPTHKLRLAVNKGIGIFQRLDLEPKPPPAP